MTVEMLPRKITKGRTKVAKSRVKKNRLITGTGHTMDVYSGGKRLPPGKSVFDFHPSRKTK